MVKLKKVAIILSLIIFIVSFQINSHTFFAAANDVTGIITGKIYYIRNAYTGLYLDACGGGTDYNLQNVIACSFNGNKNQQWKAIRNSDGTYTFMRII